MTFSEETLARVRAEAEAVGLTRASEIATQLRVEMVALAKEARGVSDHRQRTYYVVGRVMHRAVSIPMDSVATVAGLENCERLGQAAYAMHLGHEDPPVSPMFADKFRAARVNLSRKGSAWLNCVTRRYTAKDPKPYSWVDLYVFHNEAEAEAFRQTLPTGKVF